MSASPPKKPPARLRLLVLACASTVLAACDQTESPQTQPAAAVPAAQGSCPDLNGSYVTDDPDTEQALSHTVHWARPGALGGVVSFSGDAHFGLDLALGASQPGGPNPSVASLSRSTHYRCQDGWLVTGRIDKPGAPQDDSVVTQVSLAFARNTDGGLAVRKDTYTHRQLRFSVWCGDGCRYITLPLPLTHRHRTEWVEWHNVADDVGARTGRNARPGETEEQALRRLVLKRLPPGSRIDQVEVLANGARMRLSLPFGADVTGVQERLLESALAATVVAVEHPLLGGPRLTLQLGQPGDAAPPSAAERRRRTAEADAENPPAAWPVATHSQAASAASPASAAERDLASALPAGVKLRAFEASDEGTLASLACTGDIRAEQVLAHLLATGRYGSVALVGEPVKVGFTGETFMRVRLRGR